VAFLRRLSLVLNLCYRERFMTKRVCVGLGLLLLTGASGRVLLGAECGGTVACQCGDTLDGHYELTADLGPCERDGLRLHKAAVLDCHGHTVTGPDASDTPIGEHQPSYGITLDGTHGGVVRGCKVTGFDYGILLSDARDSQVVGCETFHNGNFKTRVGYGIHLSRSQNNTVQDCVVRDSADEGIHIGNGSDGNTLIGNQSTGNGRENFYILSAERNRLSRNRGKGAGSADLYMKHASRNVIEENGFTDHPVVVRGNATDNLFADNIFGAGLRFEAYGEDRAQVPMHNVVQGGRIRGEQSCVEFVEAHDNQVEGVTLDHCGRVAARSLMAVSNDLVGLDLADVRFDLAGGATLRLLAPVRVEARTAAGQPVSGARIELRDVSGESHTGPPTDDKGAARCVVPTHRVSAAGLMPLTPVELTVTAEGYASTQSLLNEPVAPDVTVTLETPAPPAHPHTSSPRTRNRDPSTPISVPQLDDDGVLAPSRSEAYRGSDPDADQAPEEDLEGQVLEGAEALQGDEEPDHGAEDRPQERLQARVRQITLGPEE